MENNLSFSDYEALAPAFNDAMQQADITTVERAAYWCAQIGHESAGLLYMEEIADGSAYEGRADLGNTQPGDGRRYKGRGPLQVTGRHNYGQLSQWAFDRGLVPSPTYFVDSPGELSTTRYGFLGAVWYWTTHNLNSYADAGNFEGATRAINGGTNGLADRWHRYSISVSLGAALLPSSVPRREPRRKILDYVHDFTTQDTPYFCGPASTQTVVMEETRHLYSEQELAQKLGTTVNGTNDISLFPAVLNELIPGAQYTHKYMPNDPPTAGERETLWNDIVNSIDAGHGVIANIVAPPSNYPKATKGGVSPAYRGGTVYHYLAVMGYDDDGINRDLWIVDSGFSPFEYYVSLEQLATLIPPKGYAFSQAENENDLGGLFMSLSQERQEDLAAKIDRIHDELTKLFPSRSSYRTTDEPVDTMAGMVLNVDAREHENAVLAAAHTLNKTPQEIVDQLKQGKSFADIYNEGN